MSDQLTQAVRKQALVLHARLQKEIRRDDGVSTAAVGGVTKVGNELERLLRLAAAAVLRSQGGDLTRELQKSGLPAGAGTYLRILRATPRQYAPPDVLLGEVLNEARRTRSVVEALVQLRNSNNHPGKDGDALSHAEFDILRRAEAWLARHAVSDR